MHPVNPFAISLSYAIEAKSARVMFVSPPPVSVTAVVGMVVTKMCKPIFRLSVPLLERPRARTSKGLVLRVGVVQISFRENKKGRIIALLNVMAIWSRLTGIRLSRCAAKIWQVDDSSFGQYLPLSSTISQERGPL